MENKITELTTKLSLKNVSKIHINLQIIHWQNATDASGRIQKWNKLENWIRYFIYHNINKSYLCSDLSLLAIRINKLCAWQHDMPPPLSSPRGRPSHRVPPSRRIVAVVSHAQYVLTVTAAPASRVKAALSKAAWWPWPFDLESGVTCDVSYLCASFDLPRPLCSQVRPDVCDRQTLDRRQAKASLNVPAY